jgi:uncharacterized membrane protein
MARETKWDDREVEVIIGDLLRAGVIAAAAMVALGGIVYLSRHGGEPPQNSVFRGEPANLRTFAGIFHDALAWRGRGLIQLGLLVLIATPVARVAFSVYAFLRERDRLYVGVTLVVLSLLIYGLAVGYV